MPLKSDIVSWSYDNVYRGLLFSGHSVYQLLEILASQLYYQMSKVDYTQLILFSCLAAMCVWGSVVLWLGNLACH